MHPTHSGNAPRPGTAQRVALIAAIVAEGLWIAALAWMALYA